jgi:hypothetical protein
MNSRIPRIAVGLSFSVCLAVLLPCGGCQRRPAPHGSAQGSASAPPGAEPARPTPQPGSEPITIADGKGDCVGVVKLGPSLEVAVGCGSAAQVLIGKAHSEGKRKYHDPRGATVFECKADEGGMKLKASDGRLLWKVKWHEDKLKFSDNEEGANPVVLHRKHNRVEVEDGGRPLGKVVFDMAKLESQATAASGTLAFVAKGSAASTVLGLMLAERIPVVERLLLQAELLARGR